MKLKHYILLFLIPLSEIKAMFYHSEKKVDWYLFSDHKRFLCNVLEDYSNVVIFGIIMFYIAFVEIDRKIKNICIFLFILNALDFIHLSLLDMQYFILIKLFVTYIICTQLKKFSVI